MTGIATSKVRRTVTTRKPDPATANLLSKLVTPDNTWSQSNRDPNNPVTPPNQTALQRVVNNTATQIRDNQNILEMLPDMELCRQFMVSAIISPSDMVSTDVSYKMDGDTLPAALVTALIEELKDKFNDAYPFEEHLEDIISNALYVKGAHAILVLPESSIDYTINSNQKISTESLQMTEEFDANGRMRNLGILGAATSAGAVVGSMENIFLNLNMETNDYVNDVSVGALSVTLEGFQVKDYKDRQDVKVDIPAEKIDKLGKFSVHDNFNLLKLPLVQDRIRAERVSTVYGSVKTAAEHKASMEAYVASQESMSTGSKSSGDPQDFTVERFGDVQVVKLKYANKDGSIEGDEKLDEVASSIYPDRRYHMAPISPIMTQGQLSRKTVGDPLILEPPVESVVPIHVPGNPQKHIGYWLLVDSNGNFINASMKQDGSDGSNGCMKDPNNEASQLLDQSMLASYGYRSESQVVLDELARSYGSVVEADLLNRLRNGKLGSDFEISMTQEVRRLMWSRALSKKHTVALFVPAELLVYVAVDYNDYGVGRTLTESSKILASIRANLTLASLLAAIKNSTGTKTARIKLPEESDNPDQDVEYMMHQYYELNNNPVSLAETNPNIMMRHIQNTGLNVVVDNHPLYPDVSFDIESREGTYKEVDNDLMENMRKQHIQSFGMTPEQIDASLGVDFAASIFQNNLMTAKRVIILQRKLEPHLTRLIKIWSNNSSPCMGSLLDICKSAKGVRGELKGKPSKILEEFMSGLYLELPKPKTQSYKDMQEMLEEYLSLLDVVLDSQVSEEIFGITSDVESQTDKLDELKAAIKAKLTRDFIAKHNIMPEANITNTVGEGKNGAAGALFRDISDYSDNIHALVKDLLEKMGKNAAKRGDGDGDGGDDGDFSTDGDADIGDGEMVDGDGDDGLGGDDFGDGGLDVDSDTDGLLNGDEEVDVDGDVSAEEADDATTADGVDDLAGLPDMPVM